MSVHLRKGVGIWPTAPPSTLKVGYFGRLPHCALRRVEAALPAGQVAITCITLRERYRLLGAKPEFVDDTTIEPPSGIDLSNASQTPNTR